MERRHFLKFGFGFAVSAGLAMRSLTSAQAAPILPATPLDGRRPDDALQPAVATQDEVDRLQPEQVQWRRRRWRRRAWGRRVWRGRYWRRPWGWRHRVHRRRFWRRRYW